VAGSRLIEGDARNETRGVFNASYRQPRIKTISCSRTTRQQALTLLRTDHRVVQEMFDEFEKRSRRKAQANLELAGS
jgi:hypothetical protein